MSDEEVESATKSLKRPLDDANGEADHSTPDTENNDTQINPFRTEAKKKKKQNQNNTEESTKAVELETVDGIPQVTSKRQKKRLKQAQVMVQRKDDENVKTIAYLTKWHENRSEWKFEKLRQIAIQKNILNETFIPDEQFEIAIAYLVTTQGKAREHIVQFAEKSMEKFETEITDENRDEIINSRGYKRTRELLQSMS